MLTVGVLTPHAAPGPAAEFPSMAPGLVTTHVAHLHPPGTTPPTTADGLVTLTDPAVLNAGINRLPLDQVDVLAHASTTTGYAIGYSAESSLVAELSRRSGLPVASTTHAAVRALHAFEVRRLALVHPPWFDDTMHRLGAAYFSDQGFEVTSVLTADVPDDPALVEPEAVVDWLVRNPPAADAIWIGGNGFRAAGAIDAIEQRLDTLVLESNQTLLWAARSACAGDLSITTHGRLFTLT